MRPKTRSGVMALVLATLTACSGGAPVTDGSFVTYEIGGTRVRITFEDAGGGDFHTVGEVTEDDGTMGSAAGMPGHGETVNAKMRTGAGVPLEVASFGPIWAPTSDLTEGGRVYGSPVAEVRTEGGRDVAVIKAAVGVGGAFRGEWIYDVATGFAVGGTKSTAVSMTDDPYRFTLVASNVPGLAVP